eukprot:CAMPEP_0184545784 /NCGR_PEP_ID=MMETSP0199_2-20130426/4546_1 /TAXON_ID=1112570 /ORGANISM="Thraustochytrium sp., Strain LLF1b" /LENGTH=674 /DNA_ID=CAMNT_0026940127 /DNA_START=23 /DNA_END=2047 /DNA_ORIENTATION=+
MATVESTLRDVKDVPLRQHPDLSRSPVPMDEILERARREFFAVVDSCVGDKCLVFDPSVAGPLKLVLTEGSNALKSHGVVDVQELNWADLEVECETVIYLVRPEAKATLQVASQVKASQHKFRFQLHYVPRRSFLCDQLLRDHDVMKVLEGSIFEFQLGFVPYDTDVLSLGLDAGFAQMELQGDDSPLMFSARAILQLEETLGAIPNIQVKGDQSKKLLDMILRLRLEAEEQLASSALAAEAPWLNDSEGSESEEDDIAAELETLQSDLDFAMRSVPLSSKGDDKRHDEPRSCIDTLIMLDRSIDMVTPMCTSLTYESLLDSLVGIRNGHVMIDSSIIESQTTPSPAKVREPKVSMSLNSADHIYKSTRDMNIDSVLGYLNAKARDMRENWQDVKAKEVQDLHSYVQTSLRNHVQDSQLLPRHINIVNRLRDTVYDLPFRKLWSIERSMLEGENQLSYIEECIARQEPWSKTLRLACLQSIVGNGIPSAALDSLRRSIIHTYGFELLFTLDNLERIGMLKRKSGSSPWNSLVSNFRLLVPEVDTSSPEDVAYVTSGYAPLSVRIVQLAIHPRWDNPKAQETLKRLPGRTILKVKQPGVRVTSGDVRSHPDKPDKPRKVMMVFFTGGVTFAEIAALRFVSEQPDCPYHIIIASTMIVNGKTMLQAVTHEVESRMV